MFLNKTWVFLKTNNIKHKLGPMIESLFKKNETKGASKTMGFGFLDSVVGFGGR